MQADQGACRLGGTGRVAEVLGAQFGEVKVVRRTAFPQEGHVNVCCDRLRLGHELGQPGLGKAQQHVGRLDLAALALRAFRLQRGDAVGEYRADLESAVVFVKDVHGE
ncbi:MAG: hypothetical protein NTW24_00845 [Proteobacteria bacterium]|nr:hypothetical protein [Pseudomonadota bacterium]